MTRRRAQLNRNYPGQSWLISLTLTLSILWCAVAFVTHYLATRDLTIIALIVKYAMLAVTIPTVGYILIKRKQIAFQEEYLRVALADMQEGIVVCDSKENIHYANPSAQKLFPGFQSIKDLFLSTTFYHGESDEPVPLDSRPVARALGGEVVNDQVVHTRIEGQKIHLLVTASPIRDRTGRVQGVVEVSHDITELKKLERQREQQQQLLHMVVENISDLVGVLDTSGVVLYASPSHREILGIEAHDFVGKSALLRVHEDDLPRIQKQLSDIVMTKKGVDTEFRYLHNSGCLLTIEAKVEPVLDQNQTVRNLVIVARDITKKRREQDLLKGQNRVLTLIARDASLEDVFTEIAYQVEALYPSAICGITIFNGHQVIHVSPSLPPQLRDDINCMQVTELVPEYLYKESFVRDETDEPSWARIRERIQTNGFAAVRSTPIQTSDGIPVGFFSTLYRDGPDCNQAGDLELFNAYARIAALAIERQHSKREVVESEQRYKSLFNNNLDAVYRLDLDGHYVGVNQAFEKMFGYSLPELYRMHFLQVVAPEDAEMAAVGFEQEVKQGRTTQLELGAFHKNGERLMLHTINIPIVIDGKITGVFGIAKDITSLRYSQELRASQKRILEMIARGSALEEVLHELTQVVEYHSPSSMCNIWLLQEDNVTLQHVTGHPKLQGYSESLGVVQIGPNVGACGTAPFLNDVVIVEDIETHFLYENYARISLQHGLRACFATPIVSTNGQVLGTLGLYCDQVKRPNASEIELMQTISHLAGLAVEHKKAEEDIKYFAHYDPLTDLPNRILFFQQLTKALMHAQGGHYQLAVMFLDLDRFKSINDSMGHHFGDRLLQIVAVRIKSCLNAGVVLSRLGGDEFTVLMPRIDDSDQVYIVAKRIIETFEAPVKLDGHEFRMTTSIGVAIFPEHGVDAETLMRKADVAMYNAKGNGKNTVSFYAEHMSEKFYERLIMENSLRRGLDDGQFMLHYQPRVDTETKSVTSVEALLRWNQPGFGPVSPGEFIPVAEETGLILLIGKWVFYEACRQIKIWESSGKVPLRIAVNVSPRQFLEPDFMDTVKEIINTSGVNPEWLEVEVTESGLIENEAEALVILFELKALGIKISIDDFGVGYSSLNRLKHMPVDTLKIDRSFIRDMLQDDAAITKAIIHLAHSLRMTVVAEGVETEDQFNCLRQYGCDEIQGYYFAPPISADEIERRFVDPTAV